MLNRFAKTVYQSKYEAGKNFRKDEINRRPFTL